jgi:hypothetical protein
MKPNSIFLLSTVHRIEKEDSLVREVLAGHAPQIQLRLGHLNYWLQYRPNGQNKSNDWGLELVL